MKVILAGYNLDLDIIRRIPGSGECPPTPETLSAAYARISRSPKSISELRREALLDVTKARQSNQRIIFSMGHHSVAEHAVFNLDIMKVSRLALEEIERFRLVSYTEKSQRYVTLDGDYVIPDEITDERSRRRFREIVEELNGFYLEVKSRLLRHLERLHPELKKTRAGKNLLDGWAKEDARYILPLACEGQVGLTSNARNLEHMFRRMAASPYLEVQKLGKTIHTLVEPIAPSIILFPEPSSFELSMPSVAENNLPPHAFNGNPIDSPAVLSISEKGDDLILASFWSSRRGIPLDQTLAEVSGWSFKKKKKFFFELLQTMEFFDAPPREFELVEILFQAVVSASCFAQLKRHRMATLLSAPYNIALGNTIPPSIEEIGLGEAFGERIEKTNRFYSRLAGRYGPAAHYILTNSHRRRVFMKMNLRELYHFIRFRDDQHAQWDIRQLASSLLEPVRECLPLASLLLCGKSQFVQHYESIYQKKPLHRI